MLYTFEIILHYMSVRVLYQTVLFFNVTMYYVFWVTWYELNAVIGCQDGQSRTMRQFQFIDWPEQGVPSTGEGFIEFIGQVHKTKEQFGQEGPITVHCRYLPGAPYTFCHLWFSFDVFDWILWQRLINILLVFKHV